MSILIANYPQTATVTTPLTNALAATFQPESTTDAGTAKSPESWVDKTVQEARDAFLKFQITKKSTEEWAVTYWKMDQEPTSTRDPALWYQAIVKDGFYAENLKAFHNLSDDLQTHYLRWSFHERYGYGHKIFVTALNALKRVNDLLSVPNKLNAYRISFKYPALNADWSEAISIAGGNDPQMLSIKASFISKVVRASPRQADGTVKTLTDYEKEKIAELSNSLDDKLAKKMNVSRQYARNLLNDLSMSLEKELKDLERVSAIVSLFVSGITLIHVGLQRGLIRAGVININVMENLVANEAMELGYSRKSINI